VHALLSFFRFSGIPGIPTESQVLGESRTHYGLGRDLRLKAGGCGASGAPLAHVIG
jgi:hypothetical protein